MAIFGFDHLAVRLWAFANDFMVFASSAIVTGVISYFLNEYSLRSAHIVYQEVIAVITLAVYCVALLLPVIGKYRGQLLPFNLIFSYLWLTSFIFAAQDWTGGRCQQNGPATSGCALKKTVVAFDFLALIFLFFNIASETALWRVKRGKHESEKHPQNRAASEATTVDSTTPATTPAAPYSGLHHLKELEAYVKELKAERSKGKSGIISIKQEHNEDPKFKALTLKYSKRGTQILLRWSLQRGLVPLVRIATPARVAENTSRYDVELTDAEAAELCTDQWDPTVEPLDK